MHAAAQPGDARGRDAVFLHGERPGLDQFLAAGALSISLLYACLTIGPMSILSPLTAVVAVVLVGFVPERGAVRPRFVGILMAIGSGTEIGAFMILIDQTLTDSGLVPLVLKRAVNGGIIFAVVGLIALRTLRRRRPHGTHRTGAVARACVRPHCGRNARNRLTTPSNRVRRGR